MPIMQNGEYYTCNDLLFCLFSFLFVNDGWMLRCIHCYGDETPCLGYLPYFCVCIWGESEFGLVGGFAIHDDII